LARLLESATASPHGNGRAPGSRPTRSGRRRKEPHASTQTEERGAVSSQLDPRVLPPAPCAASSSQAAGRAPWKSPTGPTLTPSLRPRCRFTPACAALYLSASPFCVALPSAHSCCRRAPVHFLWTGLYSSVARRSSEITLASDVLVDSACMQLPGAYRARGAGPHVCRCAG
jgi:hypothetical protein